MKLIHVGAGCLNQTPLDWDGNAANIESALQLARQRGVSILCLPELCITGYGCEDAFFAPSTRRMARRVLRELLPATRNLAVTLGLPIMHHGSLYNACILAVDGQVVGIVPKQHLAGDGLHYEPRWFKPWPSRARLTIDFEGRPTPIGDLIFDLGGVRLGLEICEDAWVANRPGAALADRGADLIINPSASHFAFGKQPIREGLVVDGSRAFGVTYVYSNLLGNEAGRVIYDGGGLIATAGTLVAQGARFSYEPAVLTDAVVDVDATRTQRAQRARHAISLGDDPGEVKVNFTVPEVPPRSDRVDAEAWGRSDQLEEEEFTRAVSLGLFDYMRKSGSKGFVVSLSGGADSTAVVCLVRLMIDLGQQELGVSAFAERTGRPVEQGDAKQLCRRLLTTVYQATRNSSATTRDASRTVAAAIGALHHELNVEELRRGYVAMIEAAMDRPITWEGDDIALQNIQARVRAPGVWTLANLENKLLLATSNRSEAAVGYTTMDGDTCGGLSPIAGIDKAFLRRWLGWLETTGPAGLGPISAVAVVNRLKPTAELRPVERGQTDEEDLMPYELLDEIEHQAIGQKRSPAEALADLRVRFPHFDEAELRSWVQQFFTLWSRNQWKRAHFAPSFHVDDKNLDPKTWCRFPILSGGFKRELRELTDDDAI